MNKNILLLGLIFCLAAPVLANEASDQDYINKLNYRHNKLEIVSKTRIINVNKSYSSTDINYYTYTYEAYTQNTGNIDTSSTAYSTTKEKTDWYIFKGGLKELSDLEFLQLVGDQALFNNVNDQEDFKGKMRMLGNGSIALGVGTMIGGAAMSAGQPTVTGGAILTAIGFFVSALNLSPHHYIQSDYAQSKVDDYNISLKRKLNLPLSYE